MAVVKDFDEGLSNTSDISSAVLTQNPLNTTNDDVHYWDVPTTIGLCVILSIVMVLAICGNLMVIIVVIRHRGMRTRTNMFLVNLAVADFLVGCLAMPFSLTTLIKGHWIFGQVMCTINGFLNCLCLVVSIHTLMYISIHKYFSIAHPFSRIFNVKKILIMIGLAWFWAIFCSIITVTGLTYVYDKPGAMQCGPEYPDYSDTKSTIHHLIIQISDIFIPFIIFIFSYSKMFIEIRRHTNRLRQNSTLEVDAVLSQQKRVTVTMFIVLAVFLICWLPYHVYAMYTTSLKDKSRVPYIINPAAYTFAYVNSACNPIIYAFRSPSFREGYKEILCQTPQYVVSDDTLMPEESASPWRRLSSIIGSMKGSFKSANRTPSDRSLPTMAPRSRSSSFGSVHVVTPSSREKSLSGVMRKMKKTSHGNSIIKRDDSVIVMKDGKIVCVRENKNSIKGSSSGEAASQKGSNSFGPAVNNSFTMDFFELKSPKKHPNGNVHSSSVPLMQNGRTKSLDRIVDISSAEEEIAEKSHSSVSCYNSKDDFSKTSVTSSFNSLRDVPNSDNKYIDMKGLQEEPPGNSPSQSEHNKEKTENNSEGAQTDSDNHKHVNSGESNDDLYVRSETSTPALTLTIDDELVNVEIQDDCFSPKRYRSEPFLFDEPADVLSKSQSTDVLSRMLHRYPSVEHLDLPPPNVKRSLSDTKIGKRSPKFHTRLSFFKTSKVKLDNESPL